MKYANIIMQRQGRCTIGDDIQLLAIENLYKHMGVNYDDVVRIPFHELATYAGEYVVLPISYPLYGYNRDMIITQYSHRIIPVFLGFATLTTHFSIDEVNYLRKYQPIGCRDQHTMEALRNHNILSYLNGCMTATLPKIRNGSNQKYSKIFCVDVPDDFVQYIPKDILKDSVFTNHVFMSDECEFGTEQKARDVYEQYISEAKMIITSRLHAALPCLAAGIPVVLAKDQLSHRFPFLQSLMQVYTQSEFTKINWNQGPIEYENHKQKILNAAALRVRNAYNDYKDICDISEYYENDSYKEVYVDAFTNTVDYLNSKYDSNSHFTYALWAITQTADNIYHHITRNYPNAELRAVIDSNRSLSFHGTRSTTKEWLEGKEETLCVVCAPAAIPESNKYFEKINHQNYYQSWEDKLPR